MSTFLDIIPSELVNIIFSYIDELECAINLVEISSFNKLFNSHNFWKILIREKIGYLIEALDVNFDIGIYKNIITYYKCIQTYKTIIFLYNKSIEEIKKDKFYYNKFMIGDKNFNHVDLFITLLPTVKYKYYVSYNAFNGYGNEFYISISGKENNVVYLLKIKTQYIDMHKIKLKLTKEQYMKILFYGYYNAF